MKAHCHISIGMIILVGLFVNTCQAQETITHAFTRLQIPTDTETVTLQYRTAHDAVAPSQFVALYTNGMTMGLTIDWKIDPAMKHDLDRVIANYEKEIWSGATFTVKAVWVRKGFELIIYDIKYDF